MWQSHAALDVLFQYPQRLALQRLATLELPKDVLEHRTERLRAKWIEYLAHVRVAGDMLNAVDSFQVAFCAFLVKSE